MTERSWIWFLTPKNFFLDDLAIQKCLLPEHSVKKWALTLLSLWNACTYYSPSLYIAERLWYQRWSFRLTSGSTLNVRLLIWKIQARSISSFVFQCESARVDVSDVWSLVQSVMQMLLTDYLDFKSKNAIHQQSASTQVSQCLDFQWLVTLPRQDLMFTLDLYNFVGHWWR